MYTIARANGDVQQSKRVQDQIKNHVSFQTKSCYVITNKQEIKVTKEKNGTQPPIMYKKLTGNYAKVKHKNSDCVTPEESRRNIQY